MQDGSHLLLGVTPEGLVMLLEIIGLIRPSDSSSLHNRPRITNLNILVKLAVKTRCKGRRAVIICLCIACINRTVMARGFAAVPPIPTTPAVVVAIIADAVPFV